MKRRERVFTLRRASKRPDFLPGSSMSSSDAGQTPVSPLVTHPDVRALSFTGSVSVGEQVRNEAVPLGKRVQLELGGHSPLVVMADSDLVRASNAAFAGAYWSAGQKCTATRRIYVQDDAYDEFESLFLARIASARVGDPRDPATEVGPVVSWSQLDMILAAVDRGQAEGGTLLTGGARVGSDGYVLAPTLFENVGDTDVSRVRRSLRPRRFNLSILRPRRSNCPSKRTRFRIIRVHFHEGSCRGSSFCIGN